MIFSIWWLSKLQEWSLLCDRGFLPIHLFSITTFPWDDIKMFWLYTYCCSLHSQQLTNIWQKYSTLLNCFVGDKDISKHKSFSDLDRILQSKSPMQYCSNACLLHFMQKKVRKRELDLNKYQYLTLIQKDRSNFTIMPSPHHVAIFIPSP